jgi:hypothetical protein
MIETQNFVEGIGHWKSLRVDVYHFESDKIEMKCIDSVVRIRASTSKDSMIHSIPLPEYSSYCVTKWYTDAVSKITICISLTSKFGDTIVDGKHHAKFLYK